MTYAAFFRSSIEYLICVWWYSICGPVEKTASHTKWSLCVCVFVYLNVPSVCERERSGKRESDWQKWKTNEMIICHDAIFGFINNSCIVYGELMAVCVCHIILLAWAAPKIKQRRNTNAGLTSIISHYIYYSCQNVGYPENKETHFISSSNNIATQIALTILLNS